MPIGVPKVPYRLPGEEDATWVDLYNRLYRERILFLGQNVDDETSNQLVAVMLFLNSENPTKEIYIYINSPGGSVMAGLALYDVMQYVSPDVITICMGMAASMASFVLAGGALGKRIALPHARIMIHQPSSGARGQAGDLLIEAGEILKLRQMVTEAYVQRTNQPIEVVALDMDRDRFMSAQEAKDYGVVDQVAQDMLANR
uniref:proteolytic subunit 2 of clp protease n=1 Tax=Streptofilum capillatum TaxID=2058781 RepID=UPI00286BDB75|nr:proteolytic subunit 2 of clp protease [Streptofilum capillatum]WKT08544.1 proteolytic subunit 2 of clp protease [Streptofilum capillatum]WKT08643.1 proteolytic subunit 2 of clp protease [Streptofilum sp. BC4-VF8pt]WKT08742.1 proteolytic subunit 2 of clp protease [Streptofilum sp. ZNP2-VF4pt]